MSKIKKSHIIAVIVLGVEFGKPTNGKKQSVAQKAPSETIL